MPQVNTGEIERQQTDVNPDSPTFGQTRWVSGGVDLTHCPRTQIFQSAQVSETVFRADCGAGTSTGVTYMLAAGYVSDITSQADVDTRARAHFDATKQAFAVAHAQCLPPTALPEVWVRAFGLDTSGGAANVLITFERSISTGALRLDFDYSVDGQVYSDIVYIPDAQTFVDFVVSAPPGAIVFASVQILSTIPSGYVIRP